MSPRIRGVIKPTIEVMEALPTVILGFLAGLWLAPFLENHIPVVVHHAGGIAARVSSDCLLLCAITASPSYPGSTGLGSGDPDAGYRTGGVGSGQFVAADRNLVFSMAPCASGLPMSALPTISAMRWWSVLQWALRFIPTIFSIAEDAVFTVPRHLTQGSLALGATPWQTVTRVVLLTASPGIFFGGHESALDVLWERP